jgi:capsular polysaccharide biosynthesis protein
MAEGLNSRPLAETVIEQNNLQMTPEGLTSHLSAKQIGETQFIRVDFADPDPRTAQEVVNAVADVFSNQVYEVSPSANGVTATVWEPALVSDRPVSPEYVRNASVALLLGLILGIGLAFLVERFDERWRSPEELEERLGIPIFAGIPELKRYKTEALQHPDGDKNTRKELK